MWRYESLNDTQLAGTSLIDHPGMIDHIFAQEPRGRHSPKNKATLRFSVVFIAAPEGHG